MLRDMHQSFRQALSSKRLFSFRRALFRSTLSITKIEATQERFTETSSPNGNRAPSGVYADISAHVHDLPSKCSIDYSLESTSDSATSCSFWVSSGFKGHHENSPLIAFNSEDGSAADFDEVRELACAILHSQTLPNVSYFASNHIMVNQERAKRAIAAISRNRTLDKIAQQHARFMAARGVLAHVDIEHLHNTLDTQHIIGRVGSNVANGESIREIHSAMMSNISSKNNIIDRRYSHMGMGTALGDDDQLYLCQIFQG